MPVSLTKGKDEEFGIPQITVSPITGATGAINWGALNKFNLFSRHVIGDGEFDELINMVPQLSSLQQVPAPGPVLSVLPANPIWNCTDILNGNLFIYYLCTNGHIYQVPALGGTIIDLGGGFATGPNQVDIANWQGTQQMICDVVAQKIYSWNGSVLTTVFSNQPASFIAVYSGRLWMANGLVITWTNAGTNNSLAGDSGTFIITDGRCGNPIIGMRDSQGSLYVFGSNWIKTINSLQDVGSPPVLIFQQPTLESQISIINKWSIVEFGAALYFANVNGFWQLNGSFPQKISNPLDGFFSNLVASGSSFSAAYGVVWNIPCLFWQVQWGVDNNFCVFGYTINQQWFRVIPQTGSSTGSCRMISGATSSAITQNQPIVFYTDGTNVYNLFGTTNAVVTSQLNTKIWDFLSKLDVDFYTNAAVQLVVFGPTTVSLAEVGSGNIIQGPATPPGPVSLSFDPSLGDWVNNQGAVIKWFNNFNVVGQWQGVGTALYALAQYNVPFQDRNMGVNITISGVNTIFQAIVVSYRKTMIAKG